MSSLNAALSTVGQFGVDSDKLDEDLQEFLFGYQLYQHKVGLGKQNRQILIDYQITCSALEKELSKDWNLYLPTKLKKLCTKRKYDDSLGEASTSEPTCSTDTDVIKTPDMKSMKKMKFKKLTPKVELLNTFDCHICVRKYNWLKALKKHMKEKHPTENVSVDLKEISDLVTCRMCNMKQQRNLIMRHLCSVHNVMKDGNCKMLRGFKSVDDGVTWQPLFLSKGEMDPPSEWTVEASPLGDKIAPVEIAVCEEDGIGDRNNSKEEDEKVSKSAVSSLSHHKTVAVEQEGTLMDCDVALQEIEDEFVREKEMSEFSKNQDDLGRNNQEVLNSSPVNLLNHSLELDSDCEVEDSSEFSESRLEMKKLRYKRRDQVEKSVKHSDTEGNKAVIIAFVNFIKKEKFATATNPEKLSTINKECGHLFYYNDSLLEYVSKEDPTYLLSRHLDITAVDLLEVKDPKDWIDSVGGSTGSKNPSRRKEKLKAHAKWREFVKDQIEEQRDFEPSLENLMKKDLIVKRLDKIGAKIADRQTFTQLSQLETQERLERLKAKEILNPSHSYNETNSVEVWFNSQEAMKEEDECIKIWEKAMAGRKIGSREFTKFATWTRFTVALEDKNRRSVYNFSNKDFRMRCKKWLPEPGNEVDQIQLLPEQWNPDIPPKDTTEPSCWVLKLTGSLPGLKGGRAADLILTKRSHELCMKFKDLKQTLWDDEDLQDESNFFVNFKGSPLGPMQRSKGSLFAKFSIVTGVSNPTQNSIRRGVESKIQSNPALKSKIENLQSHSKGVGLTHYDKSGTNIRASFIDQLSSKESPIKTQTSVPEAVKKKREADEINDENKNVEIAQKLLISDKMRKNTRLNRKCKILPLDREFLQLLFTNPEAGEIFHALNASFPGISLYY